MKILYLIDQYKPEYYSGAIKFAENIINHFANNNEIIIISYSQNIHTDAKKFSQILYWKEQIDGISCIKFYLNNKYINYELLNNEIYEFAVNLINKIDPDIIHFCHTRRVASFIKAAIDLNKKYLITFTDNFFVCPNLFLFTKDSQICNERHKDLICSKKCNYSSKIISENKKIVDKYVINASALITPSEFQKKIYEEYFNKEFIVINHGNLIPNKEIRLDDYPKQKLIFSFTANSEAHKGLMIAVAAFNSLTKNINAELYVYGYCDDSIRLLSGNKVIFKGQYNNSEVSKILKNVDFVLCPSIWYENYPFTITEALANDVPVIASNEGGMKELVKNCINGFTFEVGNYKDLARIIEFLYLNQNVIKFLKTNINKQHIQSIDDEIESYENIYSKCLNNQEIKIEKSSILSSVWKEMLMKKYRNINLQKYRPIIYDIAKKYNYYINDDKIYRFILRLNNMEQLLRNKHLKSLIIWGTGTSAKLTIQILRKLYKDINIDYVVDKFKEKGIFEDLQVKNVSYLQKHDFNYVFICTSPGKKDAIKLMDKLDKKINKNYNFGICVE
ncbi:glycosyltransferase [Clostridium sp. BJN0001]|uniref:glycosyltransferase n=1 Tax=Clostridium sp. BJN0001 TaxID=2930219 RepID=UPI001FD244C0|nr:glycosyltransferase [Clostridium sp. BJN0001]